MSKKAGKEKGVKAEKQVVGPLVDECGYSNFNVQNETTNLILAVEGKKLFVHKDVIAVNCCFLRDQINGLFEEESTEKDHLEPEQAITEAAGDIKSLDNKSLDPGTKVKPNEKIDKKALDSKAKMNQKGNKPLEDENKSKINDQEDKKSLHQDNIEADVNSSVPAKEKPVEKLKELPLEGASFTNVLEFLKCLYPPHKPITEENIDVLAPMVGEYDVDILRPHCEKVLSKRPPSVQLFLVAQKCKLPDLMELTAEKLAQENDLTELQKQEGFEELDVVSKAELYRRRADFLEDRKRCVEDAAALLYPLTRSIIPIHKCSSVKNDRFGYLVITTTGEDGKKKREVHNDSALVEHTEIKAKCKDCVISFGQDCHGKVIEMCQKGAFDTFKKKFEVEKKKEVAEKANKKPGRGK